MQIIRLKRQKMEVNTLKNTMIRIYVLIILTGVLCFGFILSYILLLMAKTDSVLCLEKEQDDNPMKVVSLEEFHDIINGENDGLLYIYIGRDTCPECQRFYPQLCELMEENNMNIIYYSTEPDRYERPDETNEILNSVGIEKVPAVVEMEDDQIKNIFDGEDFIKYVEGRI